MLRANLRQVTRRPSRGRLHSFAVAATFATLLSGCSESDEPPADADLPNQSTPTNQEVVMKVLVDGLAGGDTAVITQYVREDYIQHGSLAPGGRTPLLAFAVLADKITRDVHRTLVDGDRVALHSTYTFPDGTQSAVFDVFRLEAGVIVEHWDAVQPLEGPNSSARSMTDGETEVTDLDKTDQNRALVTDFVDTVLKDGVFDRVREFLSPQYAQHNPRVADGILGLSAFISELESQGHGFAVTSSPIVLAQGNFVLVGSEGTSGSLSEPEYAIFYDLFRVEADLIVEHWDVVPVRPDPEALALLHPNGFF